jgi:integrase
VRRIHRLTPLKISQLKASGRHADGGGLELQISKTGTKAWLFRYTLHGREHRVGLGSIHTINLQEARARARAMRQQILDGVDPLLAKRQVLVEQKQVKTFREVAESYMAVKLKSFRSAKHRAQWHSTMATAYPAFGDVAVDAVDTAMILRLLRPIMDRTPETGRRLRGRIESVLGFAIASGFRTGDNPARWQGHLSTMFTGKPEVKHLAAFPYLELPGLMERLRTTHGAGAKALEFTILCATRTGETLGATWAEMDIDHRVWTIDAARTKRLRQHRVPLSDRAVDI